MRVTDSISFPENQDISTKLGGVDAHKVESQTEGSNLAPDQTDLSGNPLKVQDLKNQLASLPDVRQEKVRDLQKAIADGTYKIDSNKIADAMLKDFAG